MLYFNWFISKHNVYVVLEINQLNHDGLLHVSNSLQIHIDSLNPLVLPVTTILASWQFSGVCACLYTICLCLKPEVTTREVPVCRQSVPRPIVNFVTRMACRRRRSCLFKFLALIGCLRILLIILDSDKPTLSTTFRVTVSIRGLRPYFQSEDSAGFHVDEHRDSTLLRENSSYNTLYTESCQDSDFLVNDYPGGLRLSPRRRKWRKIWPL